MEAWCTKCRKNVTIVKPVEKRTKNNRVMMSGHCGVCNTKVNRFIAGK